MADPKTQHPCPVVAQANISPAEAKADEKPQLQGSREEKQVADMGMPPAQGGEEAVEEAGDAACQQALQQPQRHDFRGGHFKSRRKKPADSRGSS